MRRHLSKMPAPKMAVALSTQALLHAKASIQDNT